MKANLTSVKSLTFALSLPNKIGKQFKVLLLTGVDSQVLHQGPRLRIG